ncbi:hypothetical protein B0A48_15885 [Cryoendolithus antarcticus]|uniref:Alpha/beta hydrolase fold-3 domain-containing protein n=1 Tax=Cryoendolithus antarcticus TaxID=1507870 RepID=A0A1V8SG38_9PEZI|nr:hypothetical protein B0A48_15885 [Cryoendolithus antarcticus]
MDSLRFALSWFEPLTTALFTRNIPFTYRWRLLLLQPLAFLTYALKYLPYAISAPNSVIYIPTRSTHKLRALVFTIKAFTKGIERTGLRPLHIDFHGGSFLGGIAEYGVPFCKEVCDRTGAVVISAQYRHAPANVYPAAHEDAEDVVDWVLANAEKRFGADAKDLTISGWSAGGNLMMVAGKRAKAAVGICAAIDLRSPPDTKPKPASFPKSDPSAWLLPLFDAYAMPARAPGGSDARLNPILKHIDALPRDMLFINAGIDILLAEQLAFVSRVQRDLEIDGSVTGRQRRIVARTFDKGFHGWLELPSWLIANERDKREAYDAAIGFLVEAR